MVDDYSLKLFEHTQRLEEKAKTIKKLQNEQARKRVVTREVYSEVLNDLQKDITLLDDEVTVLAKKTKKLVASLRQVAMKEQLGTVSARADMLKINDWVTKKEVKKIVISSFYDEEQVRQ